MDNKHVILNNKNKNKNKTGFQGHICYKDGYQKVSVTMVAVHMGRKETGA